jgi:hypothetical protein
MTTARLIGRMWYQSNLTLPLGLLRIFTVRLEKLETLNKRCGRTGLAHLGIKHCVV